MDTKGINNEIETWNNKDNLIELYRAQSSHTFPILYWSITILVTVVLGILFTKSKELIDSLGLGLWIGIIIFFTSVIIFMIVLVGKAHQNVSSNLDYLYRIKDKQKVQIKTSNQKKLNKSSKIFWSIILLIIAEFCIILDAGYVGYLMQNGDSSLIWDKLFFWILLVAGIGSRCVAEFLKK